MDDLLPPASEALSHPGTFALVRAAFLIAAGFILAHVTDRFAARLVQEKIEPHTTQLFRRAIYYAVLAAFLTMALRELGFRLSVLLGAAGVLTVAIGFASQTAASNLVSGFFLLFEKPISVGDVIRVGSTTGEVISIDFLSTTLRTFDNLAVRIPNETLMKSEITNNTRFPIRRFDLQVGVAYKEDLRRVQQVLDRVADRNRLCLEEPRPLLILLGFGDSSLNLQYSVWGLSSNYLELRNSIQREVKEAFDQEGIEIPFPHRSLYAGSETAPLPIQIVDSS